MSRVPKWMAALAVTAPLFGLFAVTAPSAGAADSKVFSRTDLALDWLSDELDAHDGVLTVTYDKAYPDQGMTIDAILAEIAGGRGDDPVVADSIDAVDAILGDYTGTSFSESYAGATAKSLLLQQITGQDLGGSVDLEANLRALLTPSGTQQGRLKDLSGYGDFSNGLSQAFGVLALDRTTNGVPADLITWILAQQCANGSFRLNYPAPAQPTDPYVCTDNSQGDTDATAVTLSALLTQPSSTAIDDAIDGAITFLESQQQSNGGIFGTGTVNSNTTGLAAAALRAAGDDAAADDAAAFVASQQIVDCGDVDLGAVAYDQTGFDAGIDANRDQWTRSAAQGSLALGLTDYAGIGTVDPVDPGVEDVDCTPVPTPPKVTATLSSPTVMPGGTVTVTGAGFTPGETVDLVLHSTPISLGTTVADASGQATKVVTIPSDLEPGVHTIVMTGETSGATASVAIEVTAPTEDPQALPATGSSTLSEALLGLGLVLLGGGMVALGQARRARLASVQDR